MATDHSIAVDCGHLLQIQGWQPLDGGTDSERNEMEWRGWRKKSSMLGALHCALHAWLCLTKNQ